MAIKKKKILVGFFIKAINISVTGYLNRNAGTAYLFCKE